MKYRRKNAKMKKANIILLSVMFLFVFVMTVGYSTINQNLTINGAASIKKQSEFDTSKVEITLETTWGEGDVFYYQYLVKIKNDGDSAIENWKVGFDVASGSEVKNAWGADCIINGEMIYCTPVDYNKIIGPNTSIEFRLQITMPVQDFKYTKVTYSDSNTEDNPDIPDIPTPTPSETPIDPDNPTPTPTPTGPEIIKPTAIYLDKQRLDLTVGDTERLVATISPSEAEGIIEWTSSNENVAIVSNTGEITAVNQGSATITAKIDNLSATCSVTVIPAQVSEGDITVDISSSGNWESEGKYCYQYNFTVNNNGNAPVSAWQFDIVAPTGSEVVTSWNCTVTEIETGFTISNGEWNSNIPSGENVGFGIQFISPDPNFIPVITNIITR